MRGGFGAGTADSRGPPGLPLGLAGKGRGGSGRRRRPPELVGGDGLIQPGLASSQTVGHCGNGVQRGEGDEAVHHLPIDQQLALHANTPQPGARGGGMRGVGGKLCYPQARRDCLTLSGGDGIWIYKGVIVRVIAAPPHATVPQLPPAHYWNYLASL